MSTSPRSGDEATNISVSEIRGRSNVASKEEAKLSLAPSSGEKQVPAKEKHLKHTNAMDTTVVKSPPAKAKKAKKWQWKKPKDKPKRPLSAYNLFFQSERKKMLRGDYEQLMESDDKEPRTPEKRNLPGLGFEGLAKKISSNWKSLGSEQKEAFEEEAQKDKERYSRELEKWHANQEKQKVQKKQKMPPDDWASQRGNVVESLRPYEGDEFTERALRMAGSMPYFRGEAMTGHRRSAVGTDIPRERLRLPESDIRFQILEQRVHQMEEEQHARQREELVFRSLSNLVPQAREQDQRERIDHSIQAQLHPEEARASLASQRQALSPDEYLHLFLCQEQASGAGFARHRFDLSPMDMYTRMIYSESPDIAAANGMHSYLRMQYSAAGRSLGLDAAALRGTAFAGTSTQPPGRTDAFETPTDVSPIAAQGMVAYGRGVYDLLALSSRPHANESTLEAHLRAVARRNQHDPRSFREQR